MLTRPGSLNSGVECQQVGLLGELLHHAENLGDIVGVLT